MSSSTRPFRVIVVGAGVAGLTASHCLQRAGIDHVVLERGVVAPAEGASIAIYPHGIRILQQIRCYEAAKKACSPMTRFKNRGPDGSILVDSGFFDYVRENHGTDILLLERKEFLQILYDNLPDKNYIHTGRKLLNIIEKPTHIEAHLEDGTVEHADMILGCDGVNSRTRELMWNHANDVEPGTITAKEKTSVKIEWKCLIGVAGASPELGDREMTVVHNDRYSFLCLTQPDKVFFFVFIRLPKTLYWPKRARFTDVDADEVAASMLDHPISDSMIFGELWKRRIRSSLITVEEGVLGKWWYGRTVLAGDAAHKITPNIALGGNSTMESIVVLCNHLRRLVNNQQGVTPSRAKLNNVFAAYQKEREARMRQIMDYSSMITKFQAWDNFGYKAVAKFIAPWLPDRLIADDLGRIIRQGPKLDYVAMPEDFKRGTVPWADEPAEPKLATKTTTKTTKMWLNPKEKVPSTHDAHRNQVALKKKPQLSFNVPKEQASSLLQLLGACAALFSAIFFMFVIN